MRPALTVALLVAACLSCKRSPPSEAPKKAQPPRYCDQDLSGVWINASDSSFAYRLDDHGEVVRGKFFRRESDGGEAAAPAGDEPMLIELHRTADALTGVMKTTGGSPSGRKCPVEFGLRVSSCQPRALQVVAEMQLGVRDDCTRAREEDGGETPPELSEFLWERAGAPAPDAGPAR